MEKRVRRSYSSLCQDSKESPTKLRPRSYSTLTRTKSGPDGPPSRPRLLSACLSGSFTNILDCGDDVNIRDKKGRTPLMAACSKGKSKVTEILLAKGALVNMQDEKGWTSLMIASIDGHCELVDILLDTGAEPNMQKHNGWTALMLASWNGHSEVAKSLLDKRAQANMVNRKGVSALMAACNHGHADTVCTLLDSGADISIKDNDGNTALQHSIAHKHIVKILQKDRHTAKTRIAKQTEPALCTPATTTSCFNHIHYRTTINKSIDPKVTSAPTSCITDPESDKDDTNTTLQASATKPKTDPLKFKTLTHRAIASADQIAAAVGIDPRRLDEPCSTDKLIQIAHLIPNWMEYAGPLRMTAQETNAIYTDCELTYAMKSYVQLKKWYSKTAYSDRCHYRVLVEVSCDLGHADVAGDICKLIKQSVKPTTKDPSMEHISRDLTIFTERNIGGGAFGVVYRGEISGQLCAIKVLYPLASQILTGIPSAKNVAKDSLVQFRQECEYLESFKHPNIVEHLGTRTHPATGLPVLALELINSNLRQYFTTSSRTPIPIQTQRSLCCDIASALAYIHSRHIVHRDLCSDNILLNLKGEIPVAKVCDFGMSRIVTNDGKSISPLAIGRKGFMPPEASDVDSTRYDSSFDIFSFGAIMVQIIRGLPTIQSRKERNSELMYIDKTNPLRSIVEECLTENRHDRPSAIVLERRLESKNI